VLLSFVGCQPCPVQYKAILEQGLLFVVFSTVCVLSVMFLLAVFVVSPMKMANSSRRVSCGLDFCSIPDIRGSLQGASEAGYACFHSSLSLFIYCFINDGVNSSEYAGIGKDVVMT
jgi:hypothetical protein